MEAYYMLKFTAEGRRRPMTELAHAHTQEDEVPRPRMISLAPAFSLFLSQEKQMRHGLVHNAFFALTLPYRLFFIAC